MVTASDGVTLAVHEYGDLDAPTVVLIHGYPDDHHVWDGLTALLADDLHVVTFDVRGAGASGAPATRDGYRMVQLIDDLRTVLDHLDPSRTQQVHLVAHDWGSIQGWHAICEPDIAARVASYTSISGPHFAMAAHWMRHPAGHRRAALRQLRRSLYIAAFKIPRLGEAMVRRGWLSKATGRTVDQRNGLNGLDLYRANIGAGQHFRPPREPLATPVQVLAPRGDRYVTAVWQHQAPTPYVDQLACHEIDGSHWVIERHPERVAPYVRAAVSRG